VIRRRAYKAELDPNDRQRSALLRHAGAARFAWNWGLARKMEAWKNGETALTAIDLHRELVALKKTDFHWLYEVSKCAPQEALRNLDQAYQNFFRRCKNGAKKNGFPKFKSRKRGIGSFALTGSIRVTERTIQLPRLGALRLKEHGYLPINAKITRATVSERAGRWFVSIQVEEEIPDPKPKDGNVIGIDVGIRHLATLSDGTVFENPNALRQAEHRERLLQKAVGRKRKGSHNRQKAVDRLARQHYRISCLRSDAIHKATSAVIAKQPATIVIETLTVAGMMQNHCLAKAISDAAMAEFNRQIKYKAEWAGIPVIKAPKFYPSSKTCAQCGAVKEELPLGEKTYRCDTCGLVLDRDLNAAINLKKLAASSAVTAYCHGSSDQGESLGETPVWVGTEHQIGRVLDG